MRHPFHYSIGARARHLSASSLAACGHFTVPAYNTNPYAQPKSISDKCVSLACVSLLKAQGRVFGVRWREERR